MKRDIIVKTKVAVSESEFFTFTAEYNVFQFKKWLKYIYEIPKNPKGGRIEVDAPSKYGDVTGSYDLNDSRVDIVNAVIDMILNELVTDIKHFSKSSYGRSVL